MFATKKNSKQTKQTNKQIIKTNKQSHKTHTQKVCEMLEGKQATPKKKPQAVVATFVFLKLK